LGVGAITGIHQHNPARKAGLARRMYLIEGNLKLGLEADFLGHACLAQSLGICGPFIRQI
jgi:hypothetical protein